MALKTKITVNDGIITDGSYIKPLRSIQTIKKKITHIVVISYFQTFTSHFFKLKHCIEKVINIQTQCSQPAVEKFSATLGVAALNLIMSSLNCLSKMEMTSGDFTPGMLLYRRCCSAEGGQHQDPGCAHPQRPILEQQHCITSQPPLPLTSCITVGYGACTVSHRKQPGG